MKEVAAIDWQYKTIVINGVKPTPFFTATSTSGWMSAPEYATLIEQTINDQALEGWEFVGVHSYATITSILIFRKPGSVGKGYSDRADR